MQEVSPMKNAETVLIIVGIIVAYILIRFAIRLAVHKGSDAIENAINKKSAQNRPSAQENLADRFKTVSPAAEPKPAEPAADMIASAAHTAETSAKGSVTDDAAKL